MTVYESITYVFSQYLDDAEKIRAHGSDFQDRIKEFYEEHAEIFGGYATTNRKNIRDRNELLKEMVNDVLKANS